ncbi:hypothetical protein [Polaromonas vacuolata]|uniref:hypothetical protein n=1 Tax=Polaromonas vacuolata TaxID=37448 RepID=UPI001EE32BB2|nr:hypothetical protein [Polaromonas vacuolata]
MFAFKRLAASFSVLLAAKTAVPTAASEAASKAAVNEILLKRVKIVSPNKRKMFAYKRD